jgi:hypothetical protein
MKLKSTGTKWKWREDELNFKQFRNLPQQEKDEYVLLILGLKPEERSSCDEIILNLYSKYKPEQNKFLEL